ncbi:NADPH-dependent F420 reductase [Kineosporia babensis]|uniref:NAD(P)-binding domain-containing protein n=1 Tax=Kineosporia babensis TaxID=499548 RepID=A0A9X1SXY5_9ACTN|nr:NAD(P)-binding domain-containing protein [Kineosporia babensis]MCD5316299.1 NAD(P)-binding domain-containing protein [Kineosporia babensis]
MRIGILGTGTLAAALAAVWVRAGHDVTVGGRDRAKADALAASLGARATSLEQAVAGQEVVLLAVTWDAVKDVLAAVQCDLDGKVLIDPTNPVAHGEGVVLVEPGRSAAQEIAELAPGAQVVKAFTLFPASEWGTGSQVTVALCGDSAPATDVVGALIADAGGVPAHLGPLSRARQLEEVAGFVIGLAFSGLDPRNAVPHVPARP